MKNLNDNVFFFLRGICLQLRVGGRLNLDGFKVFEPDGWQIEVSIDSRQMGLECNCHI